MPRSLGNTDVTSSSSTLATFQITAQPATITLGPTLTFAYTGSQIPVAVTTTPAGLAYTETYAGIAPTVYAQSSTPPIHPGTYTVAATITDPNYSGTATATEVIAPVSPQMILSLDRSSSNPSVYGTAVSFDLNVNNGAAPAPCPTGTVQFYVNGSIGIGGDPARFVRLVRVLSDCDAPGGCQTPSMRFTAAMRTIPAASQRHVQHADPDRDRQTPRE